MVKMAELRGMLSSIGLEHPETLLQSGNVVFHCEHHSCAELQELLQSEASKKLSLNVSILVRTAEEWAEVIKDNPFTEGAKNDPSHLLVHFLGSVPLAYDVDRVQAAIKGPERIHAGHRHLYVLYPDGIGTSTIGRTPGWNRLTSEGTARNWNTILKLEAMLRE